MKKSKQILTVLLLVMLVLSVLCVPAFALTESEVETQVASAGKEAVTGNVLIWFLCAVAFLKVSQKIDSFMATLGVNVGRTGGSMLAEAMIAMRAVTMVVGGGHGAGAGRAGSAAGSAAGKSGSSGMTGFFKGGLIGMAGRHITNSAVRTATTQTSAVHTAQSQVQQATVSTAAATQTAADAHINSEVHTGGSSIHTENGVSAGIPPQEGVILTNGGADSQAIPMESGPSVGSVPSGAPPQEGVILTGSEPSPIVPPVDQTLQAGSMPSGSIPTSMPPSQECSGTAPQTGPLESATPAGPIPSGAPSQEGVILTGHEPSATISQTDPASQGIGTPPESVPPDMSQPQEGIVLTGGEQSVHAAQTENVFSGGTEGTVHVNNTAVAGGGQHTQTHSEQVRTSHTSASSERVQTNRFLAGAGARPTLGGMVFSRSLAAGGSFANDVIGTVARGEVAGSITGDMAAQSLSSYMGYASPSIGSREPPAYSDVEIGRGRITGVETTAGTKEGLSFAMYHVDQYTAPAGEYTKVVSADGTQWYKQYAQDAMERKPYMAPDDTVAYHERIIKKLPNPPKRKDRLYGVPMRQEERDVYIIPPNFIEGGTLMGGMFKTRNVIEAGILGALTGIPVLKLPFSLTTRIIILCLTTLPLVLVALIGIGGGSLSEFILQFISFLRNRRTLDRDGADRGKKSLLPSWGRSAPREEEDSEMPKSRNRVEVDIKSRKVDRFKTFLAPEVKPLNPLADYVPVENIKHGAIYTRDHRYVKILEVVPVNFLLRSAQEQRSIIYSFISYLKIAPVKVQFKVLTKRADIDRHVQAVRRELESESDPHCRMLQEDYLRLIRQLGSREAITRRFFLIFEHEPLPGTKRGHEEEEAIASLQTAARTAANYLRQCGNTVVLNHDDENEATAEVLYHILCRQESNERPFEEKAKQVVAEYLTAGRPVDQIPVNEFYTPNHIDLSHGRHICIDGVYYAYLLVPSGGYKTQVPAGWLSLLVNAGDGIDLDMFLARQPKDRMIRKLGQQLRINRSKIKETSDTNTDFDDLDGAIRSGYLLKDGLSNNEDFYYLNLLVTITAANVEDLEWKCAEMKKLLLSQDMDVQTCSFCQEQAFLSSLPLVSLEKHLFERSKRNVLTLGAASCYPFTSYEMCDDNGILLGVNKHNNSLIIVDIFDSRVYKNANIAILGTSGAGKSFTMQLMATRMRRKGIQVFIVAPLKGHEFHRACSNIGGEFIQISPASKNCINVMEIRKVDKSVDELLDGPGVEKSLLAAKIQRLHIFFSLLIPDMTHEERQLLDDALIRTYAKLGITHENSTLDDPATPSRYRTMPVLGDLYEVLKESQETKRLANIINRLVHGSARTFNQQTNVSLDNKYTVLDISELTGDLLTVGMFVALDYVWDKAKENRTEEKAIYIDECWQLIGANSNRLAAEFVLEIFKIIRGYGGSAICATQDINDFFALEDGKYGKGIINNAKTKILLNLEDEEARRVQSILHLSEAEVMEITHFERGSGLISTNNNNVTVEIKCSQMEKELITTDRRELQELLDKAGEQSA